jgi:hypothetical protein
MYVVCINEVRFAPTNLVESACRLGRPHSLSFVLAQFVETREQALGKGRAVSNTQVQGFAEYFVDLHAL